MKRFLANLGVFLGVGSALGILFILIFTCVHSCKEINKREDDLQKYLETKNIVLHMTANTANQNLVERIQMLEALGFETKLWKVRNASYGYYATCILTRDKEEYIWFERYSSEPSICPSSFSITPKVSTTPMVFIRNGSIKSIKE